MRCRSTSSSKKPSVELTRYADGMNLLPFKRLHRWKETHFNSAFEVLRHMVEVTEERIRQEQAHYRLTPRRHEDWDLGDDCPRRVEFHERFNSEAWDLDELVGLYLPSLHRGAILFTLCSALENELVGLCRLISWHENLPDIKTINQKTCGLVARATGVEKSLAYLEHIVLTPPLLEADEWKAARPIQRLRNQFAHQNGRALDAAEMATFGPEISGVLIGRGFVEEKLVLSERYLSRVLDTFEALSHRVQAAVMTRFP